MKRLILIVVLSVLLVATGAGAGDFQDAYVLKERIIPLPPDNYVMADRVNPEPSDVMNLPVKEGRHSPKVGDILAVSAIILLAFFVYALDTGEIDQMMPSESNAQKEEPVKKYQSMHPCAVEERRLVSQRVNIIEAGEILFENTCYEEAFVYFKEAVRRDRKNAKAHYNLALIYAIKSMESKAFSELKKAVNLDSEFKASARKEMFFISFKSLRHFKRIVDE